MSSGSHLSRRTVLRGMLPVPTLSLPNWWGDLAVASDDQEDEVRASLKNAKETKLVLLGTGAGPVPGLPRHMQSNVMLHNGLAYVVDCGLGVTDLFARTGIPFSAIHSIFLTHHHPDHNIEYGPFLIIGWINGLQQSVRAFGPPPLTRMTQDYLRSVKVTIDFWAEDFRLKPFHMISCTDLPEAGPVMQDENVKVTSVLVRHPPVHPAYGYRFDFPDRSIAFSGDTVPLTAVAQMARGADVLVHEAMDVPATEELARQMAARLPNTNFESIMHHMNSDHSPVEEVGRIAQEAGVKMLVLSHLMPSAVREEKWIQGAAKFYKGPIIVGHDLMVI
jgi:ribonuclease BN (tRNA processing enzyme)